jgi:hypothetical protein
MIHSSKPQSDRRPESPMACPTRPSVGYRVFSTDKEEGEVKLILNISVRRASRQQTRPDEGPARLAHNRA